MSLLTPNQVLAIPGRTVGVPQFNGSSSRIAVEQNGSFQSPDVLNVPSDFRCTVMAWVCMTSNASTRTIFAKYNNGTGVEWAIGISSANNKPYGGIRDNNLNVDTALTLNRWTHLAYTSDGSTCYFLVDGVVVGTRTRNINVGNSTHPVCIGASVNSSGVWQRYFPGYIRQARFFNRYMSPEEVVAVARRPALPHDYDGLAAEFLLDEGDANRPIVDQIGGLQGTQTNLTWQPLAENLTGRNHPIMTTGMPVAPKIGRGALAFNGSGGATTDPYSPSVAGVSQSATIACWVYPRSRTVNDQCALSFSRANSSSLSLFIRDDSGSPGPYAMRRERAGNGAIVVAASASPLPLNRWSHLAATYDQPTKTLALYVNGTPMAATELEVDMWDETHTVSAGIGAFVSSSSGAGNFATATIDECKAWSRVLTPEQIAEEFERNDHGDTSGRVAYWPCDQANGTVVTDAWGSNDLTLNYMVSSVPSGVTGQGNAINFAGTTAAGPGSMSTPHFVVNEGCSVTFDINLSPTAGQASIFAHRAVNVACDFVLQWTAGGSLQFQQYTTSWFNANSPTVPTGEWVKVAIVRRAGDKEVDFYVNGTKSTSSYSGTPLGTNSAWVVGRDAAYTGGSFKIDNLAFMNVELTDAEEEAIRTSGTYPSTGRIAMWKFDESDGPVWWDEWGKRPFLLNGPAWVVRPPSGDALRTSSGLRIGHLLEDTDSFTVSLWMRLHGATNNYCYLIGDQGFTSSGYAGWGLRTNTMSFAGLEFIISNYATQSMYIGAGDSSVRYDDGQWHHVVGVWDSPSRTVSLWVDGQKKGEATNSTIEPLLNRDGVYIGGSSGGNTFPGDISDARIYRTALIPTDIARVRAGLHPLNG